MHYEDETGFEGVLWFAETSCKKTTSSANPPVD